MDQRKAFDKLIREIDRHTSRLKLVLGDDNPFNENKTYIEKKMITDRVIYKFNECKTIIETCSIDQKRIDMYKDRLKNINIVLDNPIEIETSEGILVYNNEISTQYGRIYIVNSVSENMAQLSEMFNDLHTMVSKQGETIDTIERNIEQTNIKVQKSNDILVEAETSFRSRLFTSIIFVVVTVGAIIGIKS